MANSCAKMTPHAPRHSCVIMLHSFTTRDLTMNLCIVVLEYARAIREEKNQMMEISLFFLAVI